MKKLFWAILFLVMSTLGFAGKEYPSKNINLIVPFSAGGGTDAVARKLGSVLEKELGTAVVIVNKTGGAGAVGMTYGANQKKDGYTVTMITRELVSLPLMHLSPISYKNFELVSLVNVDPAIVLVEKDSKYKTFEDIIKDAKANPQKIKFASTAKPNFYALAIENATGVKFNHIPYNGAGEVIPALLGKHADFSLVGPGEAIGQIKAGQLRAIGVMAADRISSLPDVPTLKEQGYDITSGTWRGIAVPKGTDKAIVEKLNAAIKQAVQDPDFVNFMNNSTFGIQYLDGKAFEQFIIDDTNQIGEIVKNIK